jgi:HD-GYP domain-containing protein (c-di-GMP phosphodiesterase class II)
MVDVRSELCVPVRAGDQVWGAINIEEVQPDAFDEDDARVVQAVADQIGFALRAASLAERLEQAKAATADAIAATVEARRGRSGSLVARAVAVGRRLGMDGAELQALRLGARLHDVGKIGLPDAILDKPAELSAEERVAVERQPLTTERILAPVDFLGDARRLVCHEHERWDGGGYPDGLAGEHIPLGSRVILAVRAYDAMLAGRPYRAAMAPADARGELRRCAGTQFDPRVVAELIAVLDAEGTAGQDAVSESSDERQSRSTLAS